MSHSFYMTKSVNFIPFVFNSSNIWWQVQFRKLYIVQFSPISYYFQPQQSTDWSALLPNTVYSLSSKSQTKGHTHIYENTTQTHIFIF